MEEKSPVFIKVEEYKKVLSLVEDLKKKSRDVHSTIDKIKDLRAKEEEFISSWESKIEDVDKKVAYVDQTLFEPES